MVNHATTQVTANVFEPFFHKNVESKRLDNTSVSSSEIFFTFYSEKVIKRVILTSYKPLNITLYLLTYKKYLLTDVT